MTTPVTITDHTQKIAQLYTVPEARRRLRLGLTKFYELINSGELRTVKIGARRLVSEDAITEFIARLEASAALAGQTDNTLTEEAA